MDATVMVITITEVTTETSTITEVTAEVSTITEVTAEVLKTLNLALEGFWELLEENKCTDFGIFVSNKKTVSQI